MEKVIVYFFHDSLCNSNLLISLQGVGLFVEHRS